MEFTLPCRTKRTHQFPPPSQPSPARGKEDVRFLLAHPFAMDIVRGVAEWWIGEDLKVTQDALHHLTACGVVLIRPAGGRNLYSFTANIEIQKALQAYMNREKKEGTDLIFY